MLTTKFLAVMSFTMLLLIGCTSTVDLPGPGNALPPCGILPNCVNTENGEGGQAIDPIKASPAQWQALKRWLAAQADWDIVTDNGDLLQAVVTTPTMRFRDDVQMRFDGAAGVIQVRSSSRLGIGDMGANRARVERLRALVADTSP